MITKLFAQTDPRWAKELLGNNTDPKFDLGNYGCLVTAFGNMLTEITGNMQYTPDFTNTWMKQHNGFPKNSGLFIWSAALGLGHVEAHGTTTNLALVNNWLQDPPNFAILEVRAQKNVQHFVMAPSVDKIVDSEDGLLKSMGTYPFINAHLYRSTDPLNQPAAAPVAKAKNGTVTVTGKPFLNLRTGPGTNFGIGKGTDGQGHTIYTLPAGAVVEYYDVVPADPASKEQGPWLVSNKKNYFAADFTTYKA